MVKRWVSWAAILYPETWRQRYGAEFRALLDDIHPGWREFVDVLRGALVMQVNNGGSVLKMAGAMAAVGAAVALAVSFAMPGRYVSRAVVRGDGHSAGQLQQIQQETLSRSSLAELIQRPSLDLYKGERRRIPMEDVIEQMRRNIHIEWIVGSTPTLNISFDSPDREKAQAVVGELVRKFTEGNVAVNRSRETRWSQMWPQAAPPEGSAVEIVDAASAPVRAAGSNRLVFVAWGLGVGLALGLLVALARRQPKWTLRLAAFAGAGLVLGGAVSFLIPEVYVSTAVMRITPPEVPGRLRAAVEPVPALERLRQIQQRVLSRDSLQGIIEKPALDLYRKERTQTPLEDVIAKMRRDISIRRVSLASSIPAFSISFSYTDPEKAQAVVRELVTRFAVESVRQDWATVDAAGPSDEIRQVFERKMGANFQVVDPASGPQRPAAPNPFVIAALGMTLGILVWALIWRLRSRRSEAPQPA